MLCTNQSRIQVIYIVHEAINMFVLLRKTKPKSHLLKHIKQTLKSKKILNRKSKHNPLSTVHKNASKVKSALNIIHYSYTIVNYNIHNYLLNKKLYTKQKILTYFKLGTQRYIHNMYRQQPRTWKRGRSKWVTVFLVFMFTSVELT